MSGDEASPFPCSPVEKEAMERLKLTLHEASEDAELQNDKDIFPFFALTTLTHPQTHPTFTNDLVPGMSIFEAAKKGEEGEEADLTNNG